MPAICSCIHLLLWVNKCLTLKLRLLRMTPTLNSKFNQHHLKKLHNQHHLKKLLNLLRTMRMTPTLNTMLNQHLLKMLLNLSRTMRMKLITMVKPEKTEKKSMLRPITLQKTLLALMTRNPGKTDLALKILSERKDSLERTLTKIKKRKAHQCGKE